MSEPGSIERDRVIAEKSLMAADLWMALGGDSQECFAYMGRNGFATTWTELLARVNIKPMCGRNAEGREAPRFGGSVNEMCVLREGHSGPCYGSDDVGQAEPLPIPLPWPRGAP